MLDLQVSLFAAIFVVVLWILAEANGEASRNFHKKLSDFPTLYVDSRGHGNFTSIQSAINYIPSNNRYWIRVYVTAGIYREQIHIPRDKAYIYMQGEGKWKSRVIWDGHDSIATSATLISEADNIIIKSMSFVNSYNYPAETNNHHHHHQIMPALAAKILGDKSAFYRCGFLGLQDTLWDERGRHYFKLCTIQGAVDFIFGAGQSIYERCSISVVASGLGDGIAGFITAQGRSDPNQSSGFIFKSCNIFGTGKTFLGRPWRPFARVIFYNTSMSEVVVPLGWNAWGSRGREQFLTFGENDCWGAGANTAGRVSWEYKLDPNLLNKLTDMTYVDSEGWINNQIFNMLD